MERDQQSRFGTKLISGLPMAILFCLPILLFIAAIFLFFPVWYTRVSNQMEGAMITILMAIIICILFFSYFRMQYKWEMNEQLYLELKHKENKIDNFTN